MNDIAPQNPQNGQWYPNPQDPNSTSQPNSGYQQPGQTGQQYQQTPYQQPGYHNQGYAQPGYGAPGDAFVTAKKPVNKVAYALLAFFLGGLGAHKFYEGKVGLGILYLVFVWTAIPAIVAFIEFIIVLTKPADANGNVYL